MHAIRLKIWAPTLSSATYLIRIFPSKKTIEITFWTTNKYYKLRY